MREEILKAVAQPPKFLFAPMVPAMINMGIQFPLLFMGIGVAEINPMFFILTILIAHGGLVGAGIKEPHLSTMMQAYGRSNKISTNLYTVRGNKFEP